MILCVRDFVRELGRQGQAAITLLNGHMENAKFAAEGVDLTLRDLPAGYVKVVSINWREHLVADVLHRLFPEGFPGWEAEHAGLTDEDRPATPTYAIAPEPPGLVRASGVLHQAHGAATEKGAALVDFLVQEVAAILEKEFSSLAR